MLFRKIRYILNDYIFEFEIIIFDNKKFRLLQLWKEIRKLPFVGYRYVLYNLHLISNIVEYVLEYYS